MAKKTVAPKGRKKTKTDAGGQAYKEKIAATIANLDALKPTTPKAAAMIALLKSWLQDESGYDEETWPKLKKALDDERRRQGARTLFDD